VRVAGTARAREAAGQKLTLREVAEELGVAPSTIREWLRELKSNNMVYEPRHDLPPEYDGVVEARLRRLVERQQQEREQEHEREQEEGGEEEGEEEEEGVADVIDCKQAAFILGVSYYTLNNRLHAFKRSNGRYTPLTARRINNVLKSLTSVSSSHSETNTSCHMADGDSVHSPNMRNRRKRHTRYHDDYGEDDDNHNDNDQIDASDDANDDDRHDRDDRDDRDDHDDDDELCRRLAYQPSCSLPSVVDDRIPTRTEHHIRNMYRGYLQRLLGLGAYDRLNEHTLRRLVAAREAARQKLTQRGVAKELGVDESTIRYWLRKLKKNNMVYEAQHDPPSEHDGVVEDRLRRLVAQEQEQEERKGDAIDYTQAAFILGVSNACMDNRLQSFKRSNARYTPLSTKAISNVLESLASASSSLSETNTSCHMADGDSVYSPGMRTRRKRHGSYHGNYGDDDGDDNDDDDDGYDDDDSYHDDDGDDNDDDDDDELCRRLAYQPNCSLPSVIDDRIPTRTEHHITTMYRGYLQRVLGRPGEYDRLNEHMLRRLVAAKAREAATRRLTQADVAEELGVDQPTISAWLRKLKKNNMVYEPQHDPPSEYNGVVEDRLRRLIVQEQEQGVADAIDCKQAAFILGVSYQCTKDRLQSFRRDRGSYTPLRTRAINSVLRSLASASSSNSETNTSCNIADGDSLHSPYMHTRRKTHGSYHHRHDDYGEDDSYDDDDAPHDDNDDASHDDDHDDGYDDDDDDDDDELCRRLAYQPNCSLASVVDDRIPTRTEHHITTMYRGYLQRMLGRPGEYDRLNEHTLHRLSRAREAARRKLTQADVAEELGVTQPTMTVWLRKLKKNNMEYEPRHDPPSEYDGVVEARLRRLIEQEQEEREADAIDLKQAAFILGVSYDCMKKRLQRFHFSKGRYTPLNTKAINNVLESLRLAGASSCPQTDDTLSVADDGFVHALGKRKRTERHDVDHHRESPDLEAQKDNEDNSPAAEALSALEAALLLS
jgi:transposase-like protein